MDFPASLQALYVEELADTLPTCVCYQHDGNGKFYWALAYCFDALSQAVSSEAQHQPELKKFVKAVATVVQKRDSKEFLGDGCMHMKDATRLGNLTQRVLPLNTPLFKINTGFKSISIISWVDGIFGDNL